jgi:hypothetical protein
MLENTTTLRQPPQAIARPAAFRAAPIAQAERLAIFASKAPGATLPRVLDELRTWRDREGLALSDALLEHIAAHVVPPTGVDAPALTPRAEALRLWRQGHASNAPETV